MQITRKICKFYLLAACFALSTSASPILVNGCEKCSYSVPPTSDLPGVTTTFTDEHGHVVTQVKKEAFNNDNGQNSHIVEIEENKQLPNGYSKSFKKEYSSSSVSGGVQPAFIQKPLAIDGSFKTKNLSFGGGSAFEQNNHQSLLSGNSGYIGIASGSQSSANQDLSNIPGVTTTFRDQQGNIVTQVKKEVFNNQNGQNAHVLEYEENKQLPNGYSKSFKKEYSSSSVTGVQPKFVQKPLGIDSLSMGGFEHNNHQSLLSGNSGYLGITPGLSLIGSQPTVLPQPIASNNHVLFQKPDESKQLNGYSTFFNTKQTSSNINVLPSVYPTSQTQGLNTNEPDCSETSQVNVDTNFNGQKQLSFTERGNNNYQTSQPLQPNIVSHSQSYHSEKVIKPVIGQQTVVPVGQQSLNIDSLSTSNTASSNKFEKYESFNTQEQQFGQQSVNIDDISPTSSQLNQQKEPFGQFYKPNTQVGQQIQNQESFYTQNHNAAGQQVVDINKHFNTNQQVNIGQQTVSGDFSQSKLPVGQQSVDISQFGSQNQEVQSSFTNSNRDAKLTTDQQSQGSGGIFTSKYGGTHILDLGTLGQTSTGSINHQNLKPAGQENVLNSNYGQHYTNGKLFTSPVNTHGQQSVVFESQRVVEKNIDLNRPDYGQQFAQNVGYQSSGYSSNGDKLVSVNDQTSNVQYNKAFNKLDQLEHEVLGAQNSMNLQKDNVQTTYSSNYNLKSMPIQTGHQESYFQKKVDEHEQYVEPLSEYNPASTQGQYFASSSYVQKNTGKASNSYDVEPTMLVQQKEKIEKHFEVLPENNTNPQPLWKRIGEKVSNSFQAARGKAHQIAATIEEKVGFSQNTEKPC
ncbi:uncharacterized protein LOC126847085 [Adelges cooleyi]|uniref:uncharacterized protein LOC126847085 n=1 Tax=Adelges cooleyi TaxID=133065 RepID=UPI00217FFD46|nr:uncharacterized protein LOC126847085 [Adelges cooleyi]